MPRKKSPSKTEPKVDRPEPPHGLRVLSYNIHQGITASRRQIALSILKEALKALKADIVLLQEVAGRNLESREMAYQLEALADEIWPYHAYQKNSVFSSGTYHGNAILSRYPITEKHLLNITLKGMKKRGVLHAEIEVPHLKAPIHVLGTHLGLLQYERQKQVSKICSYVKSKIDPASPLLIGGDFNDWQVRVTSNLAVALRMEEAFLTQDAKHARTFPSHMPVLKLDRIYYRGFHLHKAMRLRGRPWKFLSDHLPILAHFKASGHGI